MRSTSPRTGPRPTWTSATTSGSSTSTSTRPSNVTTGQVYSAVIAKERRGEYLGRHRAGHPAHHRRDQGADAGQGRLRRRRHHHRDRRHGRRHRVPAVPRGRPPGPPGRRPRQRVLRPRLAGAVHRPVGGAEDQAHPALGGRAAQHRHPARRDRLPRGPPRPRLRQAQDRQLLRRGRRGRRGRDRRPVASTTSPRCCTPRAWTPTWSVASGCRSGTWTGPQWDDLLAHGSTTPPPRSRSRWSASTPTCPTPTCRSPRRCGPAASPTTPGSGSAGCPPTAATPPTGARRALEGVDAVCVPGRLRHPRHRGQARRAALVAREPGPHPRACAWACRAWSSSTPAPSSASRAPAAPSSTRAPPTRSSRRWPSSRTSSPAPATWAAPCGWAPTPPGWPRAASSPRSYGTTTCVERHRHRYEVNNAYRDRLAEAGLVVLRHQPGRRAGRVRRAAARRPPVLRRHPGPPGVPVPADPGAPAVRRAGRSGAASGRPRSGSTWTRRPGHADLDAAHRARTSSLHAGAGVAGA